MKLTRTDMINAFSSEDGIAKTADTIQSFIRTQIREGEITSAILPPKTPSAGEMRRSKDHDQMSVIVDVENEDGLAVELDLRSTGESKYVSGNRIEVFFEYFGTQEFTKHEEELYAYKYDLMSEVEKTAMLELSANIDRKFIGAINSLAINTGSPITSIESMTKGQNYLQNNDVATFERDIFERLGQMFTINRQKLNRILMHEFRFQNIFTWNATSVGDRVASSITESGYESKRVLGIDFLLTIKETIDYLEGGVKKSAAFVNRDDIYGFAAPDYLGVYLNNPNFGDTKFFLEKRKGMVSWSAKRSLGIGIGNTLGAAKYTIAAP